MDRSTFDSNRDQAKGKRFQALVQEGLEDLEAGRYEAAVDLTRWFDEIEAELEVTTRGATG